MSIDLGNSPTPPAQNPTLEEASQIRSVIGAVGKPEEVVTQVSSGLLILTKYGYDAEPIFRPYAEIQLSDITSGSQVFISPVAGWEYSDVAVNFLNTVTNFNVSLGGTGSFIGSFANTGVQYVSIVHTPEVSNNLFTNCIDLLEVSIGVDDYNAGSQALYTEFVGSGAFYSCTNLYYCSISGAKRVETNAFRYCGTLSGFPITGNRLTEIQAYAFANSGLICVNFHSSGQPLAIIGASAFEASSLQNVELPSTIQNIGDNAFKSCIDLQNFYIYKNTPPTVGANIFQLCPILSSIHIPVGSEYNYDPVNGTTWQGKSLFPDIIL